MSPAEDFACTFDDEPSVRGVLHVAATRRRGALVLTHGAGGDKDGALLIALADELGVRGVATLRCDLPYRQKRPKGPPSPAGAARDREGLKRAVEALRELLPGAVLLGGSSYGGRQSSMLAAESPDLVDALLLLSYPLHPPGKPEQLRTEHFPRIKTPALFAHGTRDNFGSLDELEAALPLLAGPSELLAFDGARHGLVKRSGGGESIRGVAGRIAERFVDFAGL